MPTSKNPGSYNPMKSSFRSSAILQSLPVLMAPVSTRYLFNKHLSTPSTVQTATTITKTKKVFQVTRDKTVNVYKTVSSQSETDLEQPLSSEINTRPLIIYSNTSSTKNQD